MKVGFKHQLLSRVEGFETVNTLYTSKPVVNAFKDTINLKAPPPVLGSCLNSNPSVTEGLKVCISVPYTEVSTEWLLYVPLPLVNALQLLYRVIPTVCRYQH